MKRFESVLANVFGVIFLVLSAVVTVETIARKCSTSRCRAPTSSAAMRWRSARRIAFSLALMGRNHIRVDVFHERFSRRMQARAELAVGVALAVFAVVHRRRRVQGAPRHVCNTGSTAQTPWATPLIYPQSVWYAGLVFFALVAIGYAARATWLLVTRPHRRAQPRIPSEERQGRTQGRARRPRHRSARAVVDRGVVTMEQRNDRHRFSSRSS